MEGVDVGRSEGPGHCNEGVVGEKGFEERGDERRFVGCVEGTEKGVGIGMDWMLFGDVLRKVGVLGGDGGVAFEEVCVGRRRWRLVLDQCGLWSSEFGLHFCRFGKVSEAGRQVLGGGLVL